MTLTEAHYNRIVFIKRKSLKSEHGYSDDVMAYFQDATVKLIALINHPANF